MERKRISFEEWKVRLNALMAVVMGRTTSTFEGWNWRKLYDAGCTPGRVVDAMAQTWEELGVFGVGRING
ncbi:MAG: hypothetical protein E6R03_09780 [Hyphomicrobiaceae bacterium]|nr:MAG: hypothetical protein E6R03_09780 [Hyphomicrobiaceae bacterium]